MAGEFDIYFKSGSDTQVNYAEGDNVASIEITNSDQDYYQNGMITLFDVPSSQALGDTVMIFIEGTLQFDGYVARRQQQFVGGKKTETYQIVGKTYDLWRHKTGSNDVYADVRTGFIASSLVAEYGTDISIGSVGLSDGALIGEIDLSNMVLGDALVELTSYDGFKFYVDNTDTFQYRYAGYSGYQFTIEEDDILDMTPLEEADEDLVNDVLVVGGTGYTEKTNVDNYGGTFTNPSSMVFPSAMIVAQRFKAEGNTLSAVKLWLDRSRDPNQPAALDFEIWENTSITPWTDDFANYDYLSSNSNAGMNINVDLYSASPAHSYLELGHSGAVKAYDQTNAGTKYAENYAFAMRFLCTGNFIPISGAFDLPWNYANKMMLMVSKSGASSEPVDTFSSSLAWGNTIVNSNDFYWCRFNKALELQSGNQYCLVFKYDYDNSQQIKSFYSTTSPSNDWYKQCYKKTASDADWVTTTRDFKCKLYGKPAYHYTGQILSDPYFSDCKYMKVSLLGPRSSNHIFISGSNDNEATWIGLTDSEWHTFDSESGDGVVVKYKMSSNGLWTPQISGATLQIADDSGGFEEILINDNFTGWNHYMDHQNYRMNLQMVDSYLVLDDEDATGHKRNYLSQEGPRIDEVEGGIYMVTQMFKPTWRNRPSSAEFYCGTTTNKNANWILGMLCRTGATGAPDFTQMIASGQASQPVGWSNVRFTGSTGEPCETYLQSGITYALVGKFLVNRGGGPGYLIYNYNRLESYDSRSIKSYHSNSAAGSGWDWGGSYDTWWSDPTKEQCAYRMRFHYAYPFSGSTESKSYYESARYLKATWTDLVNEDRITISGTLTDRDEWVLMENGVWYDFGFTCTSGHRISYFLSSNGYENTKIGHMVLESRQIVGGGQPKSGTKIEHSDDLSWAENEIPYPPSWSAWEAYSAPKLGGGDITPGEYYWLVFTHYSGGGEQDGKYWKFWYDPSSTNYPDGKLMMSKDREDFFKIKWSSNTESPDVVPPGNMRFQLGWTEGQITATSSNTESINLYGRHFKKISDSNIIRQADADLRAYLEVSGSQILKKKGTLTIDGRTDMSNEYRFSTNLPTFGISSIHDVVSYTQRIAEDGFSTTINYGKRPYDISKDLSDMKYRLQKVESAV